MKKKVFIMLPCIAVVAIVSGYGGIKAYQSHAKDCKNLLLQNVEALALGDDNVEKKYHHKETLTLACGESIHYIVISEKESTICHDVKTMTYEICSDEGGVFTCNTFGTEGVQHNVIGTITFE